MRRLLVLIGKGLLVLAGCAIIFASLVAALGGILYLALWHPLGMGIPLAMAAVIALAYFVGRDREASSLLVLALLLTAAPCWAGDPCFMCGNGTYVCGQVPMDGSDPCPRSTPDIPRTIVAELRAIRDALSTPTPDCAICETIKDGVWLSAAQVTALVPCSHCATRTPTPRVDTTPTPTASNVICCKYDAYGLCEPVACRTPQWCLLGCEHPNYYEDDPAEPTRTPTPRATCNRRCQKTGAPCEDNWDCAGYPEDWGNWCDPQCIVALPDMEYICCAEWRGNICESLTRCATPTATPTATPSCVPYPSWGSPGDYECDNGLWHRVKWDTATPTPLPPCDSIPGAGYWLCCRTAGGGAWCYDQANGRASMTWYAPAPGP